MEVQKMNMIYNVDDKVPFRKNIVFAIQQLLAIIAATLLVPTLVNLTYGEEILNQAAALFGAGAGTLVYILFTRKKSPVFLGSSFAFISPLASACVFGYCGIILGAIIAGAVYVVIAIVIKAAGTGWVDKLMPKVIIGPTVALIGLSLCASAVNNLNNTAVGDYSLISILCGVFAFVVTCLASVKGNKTMKAIPFIIGIAAGYILATILTLIGNAANVDALKVIDFTPIVNNFVPFKITSLFDLPKFTFVGAITEGFTKVGGWAGVAQVAVLFAPVALVVFAEHIADHKNLSSIIGKDLVKDPGLDKTLLGDGVGSIVGSIFGGCPNTTYGECIGCVAITGDASVYTVMLTSILCMELAFFTPFIAFVNTIPVCIIGGICIALYGFISVSGLKMIQDVDLNDNRNLFVVATILVTGIGGLTLNFGSITFTSIATALILGIIVNVILGAGKNKKEN